jgi:hypothetical protein
LPCQGRQMRRPRRPSYCQAREFAQAIAYRRVDPDEITGAVHAGGIEKCVGGSCGEYVAITCQR